LELIWLSKPDVISNLLISFIFVLFSGKKVAIIKKVQLFVEKKLEFHTCKVAGI